MFANYCFEDGAIGVPMPYTGIKLADVSEMGYHAKEGKGEICFRGHNVMKGMVKNTNKLKFFAPNDDNGRSQGEVSNLSRRGRRFLILNPKPSNFEFLGGRSTFSSTRNTSYS